IINTLRISRPNIPLSILAIGTAQDGPISIPKQGYLKDNGQVILPKMHFQTLKQLAQDTGGIASELTLDDRDLLRLDISGMNTGQESPANADDASKRFFDTWDDSGYLLLLFIIPLALLAHRKNLLIALLLFVAYPTEQSYAFEWQDLWQTKDQQAQERLD